MFFQLLFRNTVLYPTRLETSNAFFANLVTKSNCGNVTSCHYMVYVEALSRICTCLATHHSASDFCCGSNGTTPDRETLNQQPHTSPEINTTERIINIINIIERMPVWRTRYLVSSQESTKAPLPHSRYLTTGKVLSSSVASPRTLGRL